jgi:hypothetical protein
VSKIEQYEDSCSGILQLQAHDVNAWEGRATRCNPLYYVTSGVDTASVIMLVI